MEFTQTEKGHRKLIRNGYMYVFQKTSAQDNTSWDCTLRRKGKCKARIKLSPTDDFLAETNVLTHPPSQTQCELAKVKANLKRGAETTEDTSRQILAA